MNKQQTPCAKCKVRYSSYCIECKYEWARLGYLNISEWLKEKKEIIDKCIFLMDAELMNTYMNDRRFAH